MNFIAFFSRSSALKKWFFKAFQLVIHRIFQDSTLCTNMIKRYKLPLYKVALLRSGINSTFSLRFVADLSISFSGIISAETTLFLFQRVGHVINWICGVWCPRQNRFRFYVLELLIYNLFHALLSYAMKCVGKCCYKDV